MSQDYSIYDLKNASFKDFVDAKNMKCQLCNSKFEYVAICKEVTTGFNLTFTDGSTLMVRNSQIESCCNLFKVSKSIEYECSEREFKYISAEEIRQFLKGEIKIETRHGIEVNQLVILKKPYCQGNNNVMKVVLKDGTYVRLYKSGKFDLSVNSNFDLFIKK